MAVIAATGARVAKGGAPTVTGGECRSWVDHPVIATRTAQHQTTAPAHPSRPAAPGLVTHAVAPAVRQDASGTGFPRPKPLWPFSACEAPVRRKPAPAGRRSRRHADAHAG